MTRVSTQGSVTVTLNVITKDLARYSVGFCLRNSDWNYQQSPFRLGYETSNLRVSEKEVYIIFDVSSSIILFCIWNTLWSHTSYLLFFFTRAFLENKIYNEKTRKLRQNTQKIAKFLCYYGKIHSKLPIFRVKSVKIYTGQKKITREFSWLSWQISGMTSAWIS